MEEAFAELERSVHAALETYSNVHRGSGHYSLVSTHLYEQARDIVLEYLDVDPKRYVVVFCTPRKAELLKAQLKPGSYRCASSLDIGLPLGVRALAVDRTALPRGVPFQTGGGTARLVSPDSVIWAKPPDRLEAGTPAIINVIAFARALQLLQQFGNNAFRVTTSDELTADRILYHDELEHYSGQELSDKLRQTLVGSGVQVPTVEGPRPFINLDNSASTPTFAPIWEAARQAWRQTGQVQDEIIEEVRSICATVLGAPPSAYDVVFTSNTTEAINLVAESLRIESVRGVKQVVLNTFLEHNSNELPWRYLPGSSMIRLQVDREGFMDIAELEVLLRANNQKAEHGERRIALVAISGASNVLGTFNDLKQISRIVHDYGARLLVDAAQLVAHRRVDMQECAIDYLAFSAHKVYAPFGSGALVVRKGLLHFSPAQMELIRSSGQENALGIAALGKALVLLQRIGLESVQEREQALTERLLRGLAQIPGIEVFGIKDPDSPRFAQKGGVIIFSMKDRMAPQVARELAEQGGIGVRAGCHCAHLLIKRLLQIPLWQQRLQEAIVTLFPQVSLPGVTRVSLGIENSEEEVDTLVHLMESMAQASGTRGNHPHGIEQQMEDFAREAARRVYGAYSP